MSKLILLDLDGTLTTKDTMLVFAKKMVGPLRYYYALLKISPIWIANLLGLASRTRMKEKFIVNVFLGKSRSELEKLGEEFALNHLPGLIKTSANNAINEWKKSEDKIVIVSASFNLWIQPWTEQNGMDLLSSSIEWQNERCTGVRFDCNREEKVKAILDNYDLEKFDEVLAFGDSKGDTEMLNLADQKFYRFFT